MPADMFADYVMLKLGDATVKVRRLTVKEIRENGEIWQGGKECIGEQYERLIREHVKLADGSEFDPSELSFPQMQKLVAELVGLPEKSTISDFIALLS